MLCNVPNAPLLPLTDTLWRDSPSQVLDVISDLLKDSHSVGGKALSTLTEKIVSKSHREKSSAGRSLPKQIRSPGTREQEHGKVTVSESSSGCPASSIPVSTRVYIAAASRAVAISPNSVNSAAREEVLTSPTSESLQHSSFSPSVWWNGVPSRKRKHCFPVSSALSFTPRPFR